MTTEQIKWMAGYAKGYEWTVDQDSDEFITFPNKAFYHTDCFGDDNWNTIYYPLLLQSVIEGIETRYSEFGYTFHRQYKCSTCEWTMEIWLRGSVVYLSERYADIIKAKESVIEWVYNKLMETQ